MARERFGLQRFRNAKDLDQQAQVWLEAGQLLSRNGDAGEARGMLRAALEHDPDNAQALEYVARAERLLENLERLRDAPVAGAEAP